MNVNQIIENILTATMKALPPILLAGLGGMITSKIGVLNLSLEGTMLLGAFAAVLTNFYTGSAMLGLLLALLVGALFGWVFALFNLKFRVDNIVLSIGINIFAIAITRYLLGILFHTSGAFSSEKIVKIPVISVKFLEGVPILRSLNGLSLVFWLSLVIALVIGFILKRTTWGLHIRATGLNDVAVNTVGINAQTVRYICFILSGVFCGIAGAYLSTSYLSMFTDGMTAGRGFLGNIASIVGDRTVIGTVLGSLMFSLTDSATMRIQTFGFPSQLIQIIPYVVAFLVLIINALFKKRARKKCV